MGEVWEAELKQQVRNHAAMAIQSAVRGWLTRRAQPPELVATPFPTAAAQTAAAKSSRKITGSSIASSSEARSTSWGNVILDEAMAQAAMERQCMEAEAGVAATPASASIH